MDPKETQVVQEPGSHEQARLAEATALVSSGDLARARGVLADLAQQWPDWPDAQFSLADLLTDLGELDDAAASYEAGLLCDPSKADAWLALGEIDYVRTRFVQAAHDLNRGIAVCPNDHRLPHLLGLVYDVLEDFDAGERLLLRATTLSPDNLEYLLDLGRHYAQFTKKPDAASHYITEALRRDLNNVPARLAFVDLLISLGRPKHALQILSWLGAPNSATPGIAERFAVAYERAEQWDEAVDAWRCVLGAHSEAYYWQRLAQAAWEAQDADLTRDAAMRALDLEETLVEAHMLLALTSFEDGRDEDAARWVLRALKLDAAYVKAVAPRALIATFLDLSPDASEWESSLRERFQYE